MKSKTTAIIRIIAPALALGCYLWALSSGDPTIGRDSDPTGSGTVLTVEESRQILEESRLLRRQGQNQKALEDLLKLHSAYPENHIYLQDLATLYEQMGKPREEAEYWEEFVRHAPLPIEGCPQIGQAYEKQGLRTQATDAFRRCLSFEPNNPDSIFQLAHSLEVERQYAESEELYERGMAVEPQYVDMQTGLARVQLRQGRIADAQKTAAKVVAAHPNDPDALLVLALISWRQGNTAQAKLYLERGIQVSDRSAELHEVLGRIAEQTGDLHTAVHEYSAALALDGDNQEIAQRRNAILRSAK